MTFALALLSLAANPRSLGWRRWWALLLPLFLCECAYTVNRLVQTFLEEIQEQASDMAAYEQFGLQRIAKLGPHAKEACDFSSLMVIQPVQHMNWANNATETALLFPWWRRACGRGGDGGLFYVSTGSASIYTY